MGRQAPAQPRGPRRWRASVTFGRGWEAYDYVLCEGPWAWVALRARLHRLRYPYRQVTIAPVPRP